MATVEHIGIAVKDSAEVARTFERLIGSSPYKSESVEREGVETTFIDGGSTKLELVESTSSDSAVGRFLDRRGEGLHHIAIEVDDIEREIDRVRSAGFAVLSDTPVDGADGKRVFFVHPRDCHGVLVEFCQQVRSTWTLEDVRLAETTVRLYTAGDESKPCVLLIHDEGSSAAADYASMLPTLERVAFVVAFDAPGQAGAERRDDSRGFEEEVRLVAGEILDRFAPQGLAHVVGSGVSTLIAVELASERKDRLSRITLIDPIQTVVGRVQHLDPALPVLVCSRTKERLAVALQVSESIPQSTFSAIPSFGDGDGRLAEQIATFATWT
jgi:methylmalonyl-CoA epimerase